MSKIKLLLNVVSDLRSLADSVQAVADAMSYNQEEPQTIVAESHEPEKHKEKALENPVAKPVTLEQVRTILAEKSRRGFTAAVRSLLEKYGANKLSEIDPVNYPALLAEAEVLENG